jgi:hypothetical protein
MKKGVLMIGCGSTSSGGRFGNVDVQYSILGDRITHNPNESQDYFIPGPGTEYKKLTWFCENYNGHLRSRVELNFKKSNNTYELDNESYGSGSCG